MNWVLVALAWAAQDPGTRLPGGTYRLESARRQDRGGEVAYILRGLDALLDDGTRISADAGVAFIDGEAWKAGSGGLLALYAEGRVHVERPGFGPGQIDTLDASSLFYETATGRGVMHRATARLRTTLRGSPVPILFRADRMRIETDGTLSAQDAVITTCDFDVPHYRLVLGSASVRPGDGAFDLEGATLLVGQDPLLPLPHMSFAGREGEERLPLRSVALGGSSRWGPRVETQWETSHTLSLGGRTLVSKEASTLLWGLDRGPYAGTEAVWTWGDGAHGLVRLDGLVDSGADRGLLVETDGTESTARGRLLSRARIPLGHRSRLDVTLNAASDAAYLNQFHGHESKTDDLPGTEVRLRTERGPLVATLAASPRLNDFEGQAAFALGIEQTDGLTERLPEANLAWMPQAAGPVTLAGRVSAGSYRLHRGAGDPLDRRQVDRLDSRAEVRWPMGLGPVRAIPFASAGWTGYSQGLDPADTSLGRYDGLVGLRLTSRATRSYGRWLHVMDPGASLGDRYAVSIAGGLLIPVDEVEGLVEEQRLDLALRNRLFRTGKEGLTPVLDLDIRTAWLPDGQLDSLLHPDPSRRWDPLRTDLTWERTMPGLGHTRIRLEADWDLNTAEGAWFESALEWAGGRTWEGMVGYSTARPGPGFPADYRALTAGFLVHAGPQWDLMALESFDLGESTPLAHTVRLVKHLHDAVLEFDFSFDAGQDDTRVSVNIIPLFLYDHARNRFRSPLEPSFAGVWGP